MTYIIILIACIMVYAGLSSIGTYKYFGNAGEHLSIFNKGYSLAGGMRATTLELAYRNALVIGSTGSFKTAAVLTSSLFTLSRGSTSVVILDVSGENYRNTSGYLGTRKHKKIYCFDLSENSDGFNCLQLAKGVDDLQKIAQILIRNSGVESKSDQYWSSAAEQALSMFMQYLFYYGTEGCKNMYNVACLLEVYMAEPEKVDALFVNANDEALLKSYKAFNSIPEKTRLSVLSVAMTAVKLFKSPAVARVTSKNTFDIATFRKESSYLYLCIPLNQVTFLAPLTAVMFQMFFAEALSKIPPRGDNGIIFLIDEMLTMRLELGLIYANCRKYSVGIMSIIQEQQMLGMQYSQAESFAITSNSNSRIYMPGQSFSTCKLLQEEIGKIPLTESAAGHRQGYIMEATEIRTCEDCFIFITRSQPLREKVRPFFNHLIYSQRTKLPPYEQPRKLQYDVLETMQL